MPDLAAGGALDIFNRGAGAPPLSDTELTSEHEPAEAAPSRVQASIVKARDAGYSWDEIKGYLGKKANEATLAGYTPDEVKDYLGVPRPKSLTPESLQQTADYIKANGQDPADELRKALGPAITSGDPEAAGAAEASASMSPLIGGYAKDVFTGQYLAGNLDQAAAADAKAMDAFNRGDAQGMVDAFMENPVSGFAAPTATPGARAASRIPQFIRNAYVDAIHAGETPEAFANKQVSALWAAAGKDPAESPAAAKEHGQLVEGLARSLPKVDDIVDNAIALAKARDGGFDSGEVPGIIRNLAQHWAETGEDPTAAATRAMKDPVLRAKLQVPMPPEPPPLSSHTPTPNGDFVVPRMTVNENVQGMAHGQEPVLREIIDEASKGLPSGWTVKVISAERPGAVVSGTNTPSQHASGAAMDVTLVDPAGHEVGNHGQREGTYEYGVYQRFAQLARNAQAKLHPDLADAWEWGGNFRSGNDAYDLMHFQIGGNKGQGTAARTASGAEPDGMPVTGVQKNYPVARTPAAVTPDMLGLFEHLEGSGDNAVSLRGAIGKYQIMPETAKGYGFDPARLNEPAYNEQAARAVLSDLSVKFDGNLTDMLVAYNAGPGRARRWIASGRHLEDLPAETQAYLKKAGQFNSKLASERAPVVEPPEPPMTFKEIAEGGRREPPGEGGGEPPPPEPMKIEDAEAAVASRFSDGTEGPTPWERIKAAGYRTYLELFRPDHPLNILQDAAAHGSPLPDAANPRFLRRLSENADSSAKYLIERDMIDPAGNVLGPGLNKILDPLGKDERHFWNYAASRWAVEKAAQVKETGVEIDAARMVVNHYHERFGPQFQQLMDWQNGTLRWLRDSGIISDASFKAQVEANRARVPGYRIDDAKTNGPGKPGADVRNPVKEFLGSDLKVENILKSLLQDAFLRVKLARANMANRALADMGEQAGLAAKTGAVAKRFDLTPDELKRIGAEDDDAAIWRSVGEGLRTDEVPIFRDGKLEAWKFTDPDIARYLRGYDRTTLSTLQKMVSAITKVKRGMIVLNPLFPVRLMLYDVPWQFITKPGARNVLADFYVGLGHVAGNTEKFADALKSGAIERAFDGLGQDAYIKDVLRDHADPSYAQTAWNVVSSPYHGLRAWGQLLNQSIRVGRYVRGVQAGESEMTAAAAASEAAFHRASFGGGFAKAMNATQPFTAAYLNSLEQTFRAAMGGGLEKVLPALGKNTTITGDEAKFWTSFAPKVGGLITLPMLANWYASRDEEWYKAAPNWQKNNGLLFHIGASEAGHTLFLPFPPLIGLIFGGIPRMLMERFIGENPHAADDLAKSFGASLLPPGGLLTSSIFEPIIEHIANHSFFRDQPLVSDSAKKNLLAPEQSTPWSSGAAKMLSRFTSDIPLIRDMKLSPPVIDNYIQGWGGTLGTAAVRAADLLFHTGPRAGNAPAVSLEDMPLLSSWLSRYPSANAQPIRDFQDRMGQFEAAHGSMLKAMESGDLEHFQQLLSADPTGAVLHKFQLRGANAEEAGRMPPETRAKFSDALQDTASQADMESAKTVLTAAKAMQKMREYVKLIASAGVSDEVPVKVNGETQRRTLTPADKRQILDQTYATMQVISERGIEAMDKAKMK